MRYLALIFGLFISMNGQAQDYYDGYMGKRFMLRVDGPNLLFGFNTAGHIEYLTTKAFSFSIGAGNGFGNFNQVYLANDYAFKDGKACETLTKPGKASTSINYLELSTRIYSPFNQIGSPYGAYIIASYSMGSISHSGNYYRRLMVYDPTLPECYDELIAYEAHAIPLKIMRLGFGSNFLLSKSFSLSGEICYQTMWTNSKLGYKPELITKAVIRGMNPYRINARLQIAYLLF